MNHYIVHLHNIVHQQYYNKNAFNVLEVTSFSLFFIVQRPFIFLHLLCHEFIANGFLQLKLLFCRFLQSVFLWVEPAGASVEPKYLPLWLSSFSSHFPSHVSGSYLDS